VPAPGHIVTGEAAIDIGVSGDISSPRFTGGILLADGMYQNLDLGTILTGLSIATEIDAGGALGLRLDGLDGAAGTVRVEGRVGFSEGGVDLTVETREAVLVRRDDAAVRLGVDLRIFGPMDQLAVTGQVRIVEAEIRLVNANPPSIVTLGDVRIKGEPEPDEDDAAAGLPIRLQIDVAGDRIFVRGRGLDSQWQADLAVRGDAAQPVVTGEVSAVRGNLDLIGKQFELERGRVLFDGGQDIDPRLDVVLERETPDITGRIVVGGFASDPQLSFSSTPALPEDEVLPRVLFGTSSQALTPSQGIQLALGLATLLDGGGGTLDQLRGAVGLDSLDIEQDAEGNAALAIGKQVDENIWVGTKQSLGGEGGTSVAVEVDVFENVQVQGEVGTGGSTSASVRWKKDF
jgi:translocation and assembly module TamB